MEPDRQKQESLEQLATIHRTSLVQGAKTRTKRLVPSLILGEPPEQR
jgi:hypothetical protein